MRVGRPHTVMSLAKYICWRLYIRLQVIIFCCIRMNVVVEICSYSLLCAFCDFSSLPLFTLQAFNIGFHVQLLYTYIHGISHETLTMLIQLNMLHSILYFMIVFAIILICMLFSADKYLIIDCNTSTLFNPYSCVARPVTGIKKGTVKGTFASNVPVPLQREANVPFDKFLPQVTQTRLKHEKLKKDRSALPAEDVTMHGFSYDNATRERGWFGLLFQ